MISHQYDGASFEPHRTYDSLIQDVHYSYIQDAKKHIENGKYEKAISAAKAATSYKGSLEAYYLLGLAYKIAGLETGNVNHLQNGIDTLTFLINKNTFYYAGTAYYLRGIIYKKLKKFDSALADLNEAGKHSNQYHNDIYMAVGEIHIDQENYELAIENYNKLFEITANVNFHQRSLAHHHRGKAYFYHGDFVNALADFDTAIQSASSWLSTQTPIPFGEAYYLRGKIHTHQGNPKAIDDYSKAINHGYGLTATYARGSAYFYSDQINLAINDLSEILQAKLNGKSHSSLDYNEVYSLLIKSFNHQYADFSKADKNFLYTTMIAMHQYEKSCAIINGPALSLLNSCVSKNESSLVKRLWEPRYIGGKCGPDVKDSTIYKICTYLEINDPAFEWPDSSEKKIEEPTSSSFFASFFLPKLAGITFVVDVEDNKKQQLNLNK